MLKYKHGRGMYEVCVRYVFPLVALYINPALAGAPQFYVSQ